MNKFLIFLCFLTGCTTSYKRDFPSNVSPRCYGALHYAEAATGKESKDDWSVSVVPGEKEYRGFWHFTAPDGRWVRGWTSGNGRRTIVPSKPGDDTAFNDDVLLHEAGHHVLLSNGIHGHPPEYSNKFLDWSE